MYKNGMGVLVDYVRAYMWWSLSAHNGSMLGAENKEAIAKEMTLDQIAKAQEMSSKYL
jgi:TPR repeat protein